MKRLLIGCAVFAVVAGVAYLSTLGCCQLLARPKRTSPLADQLSLTPAEREKLATLERGFLAQKNETCQRLCAKRAQLIQLMKAPEPDRTALYQVVEEIGQEQLNLERATIGHLFALRQVLGPSGQGKLTQLVSERLRSACDATGCGMTPGCSVKESPQQ